MDITSLLEAILPAAIIAVASGFITLKISAAKTEVLISNIKAAFDTSDKIVHDLQLVVAKRDTEMEGVHRELKELKNVTDIHSRELTELRTTLARMEAKLDALISALDKR